MGTPASRVVCSIPCSLHKELVTIATFRWLSTTEYRQQDTAEPSPIVSLAKSGCDLPQWTQSKCRPRPPKSRLCDYCEGQALVKAVRIGSMDCCNQRSRHSGNSLLGLFQVFRPPESMLASVGKIPAAMCRYISQSSQLPRTREHPDQTPDTFQSREDLAMRSQSVLTISWDDEGSGAPDWHQGPNGVGHHV